MARLHVQNTRRHKFVGGITTISLCQLISLLAAWKLLVRCMWPSGQIFDLVGSYEMQSKKMLHYCLIRVASDPILFSGKS